MAIDYPTTIGWIIVALYNIVFIYQDRPIIYQFWVAILDLHFQYSHQIVNNIIIGFPTLKNMGLDIKSILILQLELELLGFKISVINGGHLRFSGGYGLRIKCIMIDSSSAYLLTSVCKFSCFLHKSKHLPQRLTVIRPSTGTTRHVDFRWRWL